MKHAITTLEVSLATLENNEPINRANGNIEQADLELAGIAQTKEAIAVLNRSNEQNN